MPSVGAEGFRLSPQQRRVWALASPQQPLRAQCVVRIDGPLVLAQLQAALAQVLARHEILRTSFIVPAGVAVPVQVIGTDALVELAIHDLRGQPAAAQEAAIAGLLASGPAIDLAVGPALRAALVSRSETAHLLLLALPALCADQQSLFNLVGEVARAYTGAPATADVVQYADVAEVFNDLLEADDAASGRQYWQAQRWGDLFAQAQPLLAAPPPDGAPGDFAAGRFSAALDPLVVAQAARLAEDHGLPLPVVYLAAWGLLLARLTERAEVVLGVAGDGRVYAELAEAQGRFTRTALLRLPVDSATPFAALLQQAAAGLADATAWQEYFSLELIGAPDPAAWLPLGFRWAGLPAALRAGPLTLAIESLDAVSDRFEIELALQLGGATPLAELHYNAHHYTVEAITRLHSRFATLLDHAVREPQTALGVLALIGAAERQLLLVDLQASPLPLPQAVSLHERFTHQTARTPARTAVIAGDQQISYAELERQSNQLARHLRTLGVGPEVPVGLLLPRGIAMIVGLLGVLKAGGAYLPLDPAYPLARIQWTLADARPAVVLVSRGTSAQPDETAAALADGPWTLVDLASDWPTVAAQPDHALELAGDRANLAYIIYTSGSTGRPKGVMVQHHAVLNLAAALQQGIYAALGDSLRISLNAPISFDGSVKQLVQLLAGHTLVIVPEEARPDAARLLALVRQQQIDVLDCTPSQLRGLLAAGLGQGQPHDPTTVLFGGEALDQATWQLLAGLPAVNWVNVYGPTECTVDATLGHVLDSPAQHALGRPIANSLLYVLDAALQPVPFGTPGELYIGGLGVARGYLGRPDLTAERFVPNPFATPTPAPDIQHEAHEEKDAHAPQRHDALSSHPASDRHAPSLQASSLKPQASGTASSLKPQASRLYRTGDRVRHLPDGQLQFLGRLDSQVKLHGVRIELGEIEALLYEHPAVAQAVVRLQPSGAPAGEPRLVAYVVPAQAQPAAHGDQAGPPVPDPASLVERLRAALRERLPAAMVPTALVLLDRLPLTANGKLDWAALPDPQLQAAQLPYEAPRNQVEQTLAAIWSEVLGVEKVSINANFFDLGGHSLLLVQVFDRVQAAFPRELSIVDLFRHPTLSSLAQFLSQAAPQALPQQAIDGRAERQRAGRDRQKELMKQGRGGAS